MQSRSRGFTLLELMVVMALAAVILGIGVPSFREFQRNISDVDRQIKEPEREARIDRLNTGEPAARREEDTTSEPKRLLS